MKQRSIAWALGVRIYIGLYACQKQLFILFLPGKEKIEQARASAEKWLTELE